MKKLTPAQIEAKKILNLAGYEIRLKEKTYSLWKNDVKIRGYSTHSFLTPTHSVKTIKELSYKRGYKNGKEKIRQDALKLLGIE